MLLSPYPFISLLCIRVENRNRRAPISELEVVGQMATATMATAAGAAALLYYTLNRRLKAARSQDSQLDGECENSDDDATRPILSGQGRVSQRPVQAPATWIETISTLSETLRFTYSETLGKWPIGDLAFGINFLLKRQGNLDVASIYAGNKSVELKGASIVAELKHLLYLLTLCWHFSKKPFPLFLEATGYALEDVLLQEPKAGILKPAFTILMDKNSKYILLLIRGTHSIRDTLTAATGAVVPFHHTVVNAGGVSDLVLGYAHCGMVAAARWIAKLATPCLMKTLKEYPDYNLKVVGHSLGGGTAALLTYNLREQEEFATTTCVAFAPAACMTWELAESSRHFVTSIVNGADLVPAFSAASVDDLRTEVTSSAWLHDLRNQIERTRILSTVYRSASALGSRLPSIASAKAKVVGAGAILRPVSNGTQVVMRRARSVAQAAWNRPQLQLSSWSCIGPRRRSMQSVTGVRIEDEHVRESSVLTTEIQESLVSSTENITIETSEAVTFDGTAWTSELDTSHTSEISCDDRADDYEENVDDEDLTDHGGINDHMTEVELWQQLENQLYGPRQNGQVDRTNELREEEHVVDTDISSQVPEDTLELEGMTTERKEVHRFYPPGKVMHIVAIFPSELARPEDANTSNDDENQVDDEGPREKPKFGIFLTPRSLYGKLRLSKMMINDHFMPIYRRNIELVISELEKDICEDDSWEK